MTDEDLYDPEVGDRVTPRTDDGRNYSHSGDTGRIVNLAGIVATVVWDSNGEIETDWHKANLKKAISEEDLEFTSEITVKGIRSMASDDMVVQAAQVSVKGENNPNTVPERLVNYLMSARHGSPFEHNSFTFFVEAPLFVFREHQRHRMSSFNEMSGRYSVLIPKFFEFPEDRKLQNVGGSARPEFAAGSRGQKSIVKAAGRFAAVKAWQSYQSQLQAGVANEVARTVLPLSTFSQMYWTVNARSLMNFLSLRVDSPDSAVRSRPQMEIQRVAEACEAYFAEQMPITHKVFVKNGRIAP